MNDSVDGSFTIGKDSEERAKKIHATDLVLAAIDSGCITRISIADNADLHNSHVSISLKDLIKSGTVEEIPCVTCKQTKTYRRVVV
jgi:hypothetical protein